MASKINAVVNMKGCHIKYVDLVKLCGKVIFNKLTLVETTFTGYKKYIKMYKFSNGVTTIPRHGLYNYKSNIRYNEYVDIFSTIDYSKINVICTFPDYCKIPIQLSKEISLTNNQVILLDYLMGTIFSDDSVTKGTSSCVINMPTGSGKTIFAASVIASLRIKALYIVPPGGNLVTQTWSEFKSVLVSDMQSDDDNKYDDKHNKNIVMYKSKLHKNVNNIDCHVLVMTINSALLQDKSFFEQFGLVIWDEVHEMCSERRQEIFWRANCKYALGMSATTNERKDGFDYSYSCHLGEIVNIKDLDGFIHGDHCFNIYVFPVLYNMSYEVAEVEYNLLGMINTGEMVKKLMMDSDRNYMICKIAEKLLNDKNNYIFIFCNHIEHCDILRDSLREMGIESLSESDMVVLNGPNNTEESKMLAKTSRIIITTYSFSSKGLSEVRMNCIIFGTPRRSNMVQITGRIKRRGSDMSVPRIIVDIVDQNMFQYQYSSNNKPITRLNTYINMDYNIMEEQNVAHWNIGPTVDKLKFAIEE